MEKQKILFFTKESKTGIALFLNQISSLGEKFSLDFYFYKKNNETNYPKKSHFINDEYPHGYGFNFNKIVYFGANLYKTKKVISDRNPSLIFVCDFYSFILTSIILLVRQRKISYVYLMENNMDKSISSRPLTAYRGLLRLILMLSVKRADKIIFPSIDLGKAMCKKFRIKKNKTLVISYAIDLKKLKTDSLINREDQSLLKKSSIIKLFYIGRIDKQKDFMTALKAFYNTSIYNPKVELYVIGDGEEKEKIIKTEEFLECKDKIHMLGWRSNIFPYLKFADIFLFSSHFEGFGIVLLEAMACKVPIIATDTPFGPSEILERGKDGVLVPVGDYLKMSKEIDELVSDINLRKKYIGNGAKRVRQFSLSNMLAAYEDVFSKAVID